MRASSLAVAMPTPMPGHVTIFAHAVCVSVSLHILHVCNSSRQHNFPRCSVPQPLSRKQQRGGICVAPSHSFLCITNQPLILPSFVRYTCRSESHNPTRTRACARAQIRTHTRSCTHARTRTQSDMHVCIKTPSLYHLHTHTHTCKHAHIHTCIHINTPHTHPQHPPTYTLTHNRMPACTLATYPRQVNCELPPVPLQSHPHQSIQRNPRMPRTMWICTQL